MGGAHLMDGLMGRYHIPVKTRNAMTRLFNYIVDMAATNVYLLYRRKVSEIGNENKTEEQAKMLKLPMFRVTPQPS